MGCSKIKYSSRAKAKKELKKIKKQKKSNRREKSLYYCDKCEAFHLTSYPKSKTRYFNRINKK